MAHKDEPYLVMHPDDAQAVGVASGELVLAQNGLGRYVGRVEISDGQRKGDVFAPIHWTSQHASEARVDA